MVERVQPDLKEFKDRLFGLRKSKLKQFLYKRYGLANEYVKNKVVLDIPCGMGWGTSLLKGYQEIHGVDICTEAVIEARKRYPDIIWTIGNMTSIPFKPAFFDVVICLEGLEHITFLQGQHFIRETKRVLKNGSFFILSTPLLKDNRYHSGNRYHLCEYREDELFQILSENHFRIIKQEYIHIDEIQIILLVLEFRK